MEKSGPTSALLFRPVAARCEKILHSFVHAGALDPRFDRADGQLLGVTDRLPHFPLLLARASPHHGPREIAEKSAARVARKNIQNDQFVRAERTVSAFMRIASLGSAGHDRSVRNTARAQYRGIRLGADDSAAQGFSVPLEQTSATDLRSAQNLRRAENPRFGDAESAHKVGQLAFVFDFPLRPEVTFDRRNFDPRLFKMTGKAERKVGRHLDAADFAAEQKSCRHDRRRQGAEIAAECGGGNNFIHLGLPPTTVDLEIVEHDGLFPAVLEKEKSIGRMEACGVKHVGRTRAGGIDQSGHGRERPLPARADQATRSSSAAATASGASDKSR